MEKIINDGEEEGPRKIKGVRFTLKVKRTPFEKLPQFYFSLELEANRKLNLTLTVEGTAAACIVDGVEGRLEE